MFQSRHSLMMMMYVGILTINSSLERPSTTNQWETFSIHDKNLEYSQTCVKRLYKTRHIFGVAYCCMKVVQKGGFCTTGQSR